MEDTSYSVDENGYEWTNWEGRDYWRIAGSGAEWNLYEISNPISSDEEPAIESTSFELKEIPSIHENKDSSFDSIKFNRKHIFSLSRFLWCWEVHGFSFQRKVHKWLSRNHLLLN